MKKVPFTPDVKAMERLKELLKPGDTLATCSYNANKGQNARDIKAFVVGTNSEGEPAVKNVCADLADVLGLPWQADGSIRFPGGGMDMQSAFVRLVGKVLYGDEKAFQTYYV